MKRIILLVLLLLLFLPGCDLFNSDTGSEILVTFVDGDEETTHSLKDISSFPVLEKTGFTFKGWYSDQEHTNQVYISQVTENITVYAKWEVAKYHIRFFDIDGYILYEQTLEYNWIVVAPVAPVVIGHTFMGWDSEIDVAVEDKDYNPMYVKEKYTVTFVGFSDEVLKTEEVEYLSSATAPDAPEIEGYDFSGWSQKFSEVKKDLTIKAEYAVQEFTVQFLNRHGVVIKTEVVSYLGQASAPILPIETGYQFAGWDQEFDQVKANLIVKPVYTVQTFTITFIDYNGVLLAKETVNYGEAATAPSDPTRQHYRFAGWDKEFNQVTSSFEVQAVYYKESVVVHFDSVGGTTITSRTLNLSENYSLPVPTKANATFLRWTSNLKEVPLTGTAEFEDDVTLSAVWLENYSSPTTGLVKYRGQQNVVQMPSSYTQKNQEFRGMWISNLVSDISRYSSEKQMKDQLTQVLDNMVSWNMNALVFHVRMMNDAMYPTDLSPRSTYVSSANFEEFDYLEWLIEECHTRGIEFHAWMNPYRISNSLSDINSIVSKYANYPKNPASKAENIILSGSSSILNPGEPVVRKFLIDTCMELIERYNIDAIHFDDYFYISMPSNADQTTYNKYKGNSSTTNIMDWRREQIDIFIRDLSGSMRSYNTSHGRDVELGISPSGIYRNGNGVVTYDANGTAITSGSNTAGSQHYDGPLFSDSKKWIDEEWIDYIAPQSYWGFTHPVAGYADVVDWWAKVVRHKNVKLYTGMGIYMDAYSWKYNPYEASDQVLYNSKFEEIDGVCIYRYAYFLNKYNQNDVGVHRIVNEYWVNKVLPPR